uniref:Uncharacterized protein n=1 Tax=Salarias fasciatus TaxID=181472 RepID=A0A672HYR7_SALFA
LAAYMPRGQFSKRADQCDTSALLNLICNCKGFWFVDPKVVREVIRSRNELMHSSEFHMSDDWMRDFQSSLKCFVLQLVNQNPQMETVARQIDVVSDAAVRSDLHPHPPPSECGLPHRFSLHPAPLASLTPLIWFHSSLTIQLLNSRKAKGGGGGANEEV